MEGVILFVTGGMFGGVVGLLVIALCVASSKQKILSENEKMRKTIYRACHDLEDLNAALIKKTESYEFCENIKKMQDELKKALEEEG